MIVNFRSCKHMRIISIDGLKRTKITHWVQVV